MALWLVVLNAHPLLGWAGRWGPTDVGPLVLSSAVFHLGRAQGEEDEGHQEIGESAHLVDL